MQGKRIFIMNEIITRLNEIETKAEAIICDAKSRKEQMLSQLEFDERELDEKYERLKWEMEQELRRKFLGESQKQILRMEEECRQAMDRFETEFEEEKEKRAEELFRKIIQM